MSGQRDDEYFISRFDEITDALAQLCTNPVVNDGYRLLFALRDRARPAEVLLIDQEDPLPLPGGGCAHGWDLAGAQPAPALLVFLGKPVPRTVILLRCINCGEVTSRLVCGAWGVAGGQVVPCG